MILIEGRAITYGELWFDEEFDHSRRVDVVIYRHRSAPVRKNACSPTLTLVNDLAADEGELLRRCGKTTRYEINRAQKKDRVCATLVEPSASAIAAFLNFYDMFAQQKSLPRAYRRELFAASATQQLVLTRAACADEVLVWHAYIVWRTSAALLYSASHFRHRTGAQRALVGRANRWLHWKDMLHFKRIGFRYYDWGGLFADESSVDRAGINDFKRDFGGERTAAYNCTMPLNVRGRLYIAARAALNCIQRR